MDFSQQIASLDQMIREKDAKRIGVRGDAQNITRQIESLERRRGELLTELSGYSEAIGKLNEAKAALVALGYPDPAETREVRTGDHDYKVVSTKTVRGHRSNYNIETVLVDRAYFVYRCDCPAFRFTTGEVASAKTCKHIEREVATKSRSRASAQARIAARRTVSRYGIDGLNFGSAYNFLAS